MHRVGWRVALFSAVVVATFGIAKAQPPSGEATARIEVPLRHSGGVLTVPATINDTLTLDFVLDSGAADVQIPADVFLTLSRAGAFAESDLRQSRAYSAADGSVNSQPGLIIRSLRVGGVTIYDVQASVGGPSSSLLLGQSFLQQFSGWSIDNPRQKLILEQRGVDQVASAPPAPQAMQSPGVKMPGEEHSDARRIAKLLCRRTSP